MEKKLRHYKESKDIIIRTEEDSLNSVFLNSAISNFTTKDETVSFDFLAESGVIQPKPSNPSIVSSSEGKITSIFLTIPKYAIKGRENNVYWKAYADLILQLPTYTTFLILTHKSVEDELKHWLSINGVLRRTKIQSLPDHLHFSVWAEDGHAITKDENGKTFFAQSFCFPRYADGLMARYASNVSAYGNYPAPLYFQGGNILIGDNFFFIGEDYPKNSLKYVDKVIIPNEGESGPELVKRLYNEYLDTSKKLYYVGSRIPVPSQAIEPVIIDGEEWRQIIYMGNKEGTVQPLFHIDMFLTFAGRNSEGKYQILVGDPRMAARIAGFPDEMLNYAMVNVFDDIANNLSRNPDFEIIRNPLPLVYVDDADKKIRTWYFATSNNCLVENEPRNKTVWLPTYGYGPWRVLKTTDIRNRKIWEALGYKVNMLEDFHPFTVNLGSVHCISKYLGRQNS